MEAHNSRAAKNTLFLYIRMLITMVVSVYTSRVVLNVLGEVDFGIYNVVGGFVSMFALVSSAMTASSQRFLSFEIGKKGEGNVRLVFSTAVIIHLFLALVILLLLETVGLWFLNEKMKIPEERFYAANWVFQFSILTFIINIISVPYNAALIAFERMKAFAYVSIMEVSLKLLVIYCLVMSSADKLILYSVFLASIAIAVRVAYGMYVKRNISQCRCVWQMDKETSKQMLGFAGWNMFGATAGVAMGQGINVLLNLFFGPVVNAARGLCYQVNSAVTSFVSNFQLAIAPQIIKSYAAGEKENMFKLVFRTSRFSFILMMLLSIPVIIEAPFILDIWLVEVPEHTANFLRIVLFTGLVEAMSQPLSYAMHASGKVRNYQIVVGTTYILSLPTAYLSLKLGTTAEFVFVIVLLFSFWGMLAKLIMLRPMVQMPAMRFLREVVARSLAIFAIAISVPLYAYANMGEGWAPFFFILFLSASCTIIVSWFGGLNPHERSVIYAKVCSIINKRIHVDN